MKIIQVSLIREGLKYWRYPSPEKNTLHGADIMWCWRQKVLSTPWYSESTNAIMNGSLLCDIRGRPYHKQGGWIRVIKPIFIFILYKWKMKSLCRLAANRFSGTLTPLSRQTICHFHTSLFFNFIWSTSSYLFKFSHQLQYLICSSIQFQLLFSI